MIFRNKVKEKIFDEKLATHLELMRRKLDFEIIKDNHNNRVTQQILDRFTDVKAGMPGSQFKYQKIQELLARRKEHQQHNKDEWKHERAHQKELKNKKLTDKQRKILEQKYETKKAIREEEFKKKQENFALHKGDVDSL